MKKVLFPIIPKYFQVFQTLPRTLVIERKARGKAVPALFLQERTRKATRRASTFLKSHSSSCKEAEHSWSGQASTGAVPALEHPDSRGCANPSTKCHLVPKANRRGWISRGKEQRSFPQRCPAPARIRSFHLTCHSAWCLT